MNIEKIVPDNYQRAFSFKDVPYLLLDFSFLHYRSRNFLGVSQNGLECSYIPNKEAEECSEIGKEIFSSKRNFKIFETGFRKANAECAEYIKRAKQLKSICAYDFYDLKNWLDKMYYYFEKTEFFFTDSCYFGEMSEILKNNLFVLGDKLKVDGRPLMMELFTTVLIKISSLAAAQTRVGEKELAYYSFNEIVNLLEAGNKVPTERISGRKKSFVIYCENNQAAELTGEEKKVVLERFKEPDYAKASEFKGVIANRGKVVGKARVILVDVNVAYESYVKKLHKTEFKKGEILVTETTSPDFVPLMNIAAGIIANQGGLNSHAAIYSRELGIPCLVATYHATDILTTGDLVELDANSGVVKILKKIN